MVLNRTIPYHVVLCRVVLCCIVSCHVVLCRAVTCPIMLHRVILSRIISYRIKKKKIFFVYFLSDFHASDSRATRVTLTKNVFLYIFFISLFQLTLVTLHSDCFEASQGHFLRRLDPDTAICRDVLDRSVKPVFSTTGMGLIPLPALTSRAPPSEKNQGNASDLTLMMFMRQMTAVGRLPNRRQLSSCVGRSLRALLRQRQ